MNGFDASILSHFNSVAQTSHIFDLLLWEISENHLLKGAVPITLLWFFWFNNKKRETEVTSSIVRGQVIITFHAFPLFSSEDSWP